MSGPSTRTSSGAAAPSGRRVVAIFGGSFDPPHVGHVLAVVYVLSAFAVDEVRVVPVYRHAFAKDLPPFDERFALCERAFGWLPRVTLSRVEQELGGDSLTLRTLEHLTEREPHADFRLIVGSDVLGDLPKWHRFDRVEALAPLLVLGRAGYPDPRAPLAVLPEVSSTAVREAFRRDDRAALGAWLPRPVLERALERRLYVEAPPREPAARDQGAGS